MATTAVPEPSFKFGRNAPEAAIAAAAPTTFKLGRLARTHDSRVPRLEDLAANVPPPPFPATLDYTKSMPANLGIMRNGDLGDCTCAAYYHALQVWSFNALHNMDTEPDNDVVALYEQACGYNPVTMPPPSEGPGGNEQRVLSFLLNTGAPYGPNGSQRHKIAGFVEVGLKNINTIKSVIDCCGVCYIGFNVPQYMMPPHQSPIPVWDVEPSANNKIIGGHAVVLAGYDATSFRVISWGQYYTMTWAFFEKFVDEAYAIVDPEWMTATGKCPMGLTVEQIEQAMQSLRG